MQPIPRDFPEKERQRFWARKLQEHFMDPIRGEIWVPIQAIRQGGIDAHNGRILTGFHMTEGQLRDTAATCLECMSPEARALLLEQIKEAA